MRSGVAYYVCAIDEGITELDSGERRWRLSGRHFFDEFQYQRPLSAEATLRALTENTTFALLLRNYRSLVDALPSSTEGLACKENHPWVVRRLVRG